MGLETGTYIDSLVVTNPTSGDLKSEGDDHLRLIKATIKASFPYVTGAVGLTHGYLSGVSTPFTGTPTAPTASADDNSTQIATTAYVDAAFVAEAYPTVTGNSGKFLTNDGNITSWGDVYTETEIDANTYSRTQVDANTYSRTQVDANTYSRTQTDNILGTYASLASPIFTGTPDTPTAAVGTDDNQVASTAFVLANTFYDAYAKIVDSKAQNTAGGTFTSGDWRKRDLTTETDPFGILVSIALSQITLAAGTYKVEISCPAYAVDSHQSLLYDTTGAANLLVGTSEVSSGSVTRSLISGRFTLSAQSVLEIRHRCETTGSTTGLGVASNFSTEVYTVVEIWRET